MLSASASLCMGMGISEYSPTARLSRRKPAKRCSAVPAVRKYIFLFKNKMRSER